MDQPNVHRNTNFTISHTHTHTSTHARVCVSLPHTYTHTVTHTRLDLNETIQCRGCYRRTNVQKVV